MTSKETAAKYLGEVQPEQCFWVNNGPILKKLEDLANYLPNMSDETFKHHVNKDKNDFSAWINEVIGDKSLANELMSSRSKESITKKVQNKLAALRKKLGPIIV